MAIELLNSATVTQTNENFSRMVAIVGEMQADMEALQAAVKCIVTFDSDGGSSVAAQRVQYDTAATEPDDPTKEDYTFDGWYLGEDEEPFDFTTKITDDITLTAHWTAAATEES